jgi:hypothetical protein
MRINVRPANLAEERALLITFLRNHLTPLSNEPRFDWLYRKNPAGAALVWPRPPEIWVEEGWCAAGATLLNT